MSFSCQSTCLRVTASPDKGYIWEGDSPVTASSKPELIGWLLSFGEEARLTKPVWLAEEVEKEIGMLVECYK